MDPAPETLRSAAGVHLIGDLCNCASRATFWHDAEALRLHCLERVRQAGLTATGSYFHAFETGGVTGVVVLAESHLAIHTWPEPSYVTLDVFVCNYSRDNTEKADQLFTAITDLFQPESPVRQVVFRGAA